MEAPYHLVLVDDDHEFRRLLAEDLRRRGFSVDAVADAAALDGVLAQRLPDLIVLDWMLPGEDGPSILRRLRATPRTQAVPV
ncbi:MAG: response regulator, partial [Tepidiphilus sp.]|nr:response regulator [Tepidiphilus sp.]